MAQLKSVGNGTRKGLAAALHSYIGLFSSYFSRLIGVS